MYAFKKKGYQLRIFKSTVLYCEICQTQLSKEKMLITENYLKQFEVCKNSRGDHLNDVSHIMPKFKLFNKTGIS